MTTRRATAAAAAAVVHVPASGWLMTPLVVGALWSTSSLAAPSVAEHIPEQLLGRGPLGLALWQWLALPIVLALSGAVGALLGRVSAAVLRSVTRRTKLASDDALPERLGAPMSLGWTLLVAAALTSWLSLHAGSEELALRGLRAGLLFVFFWALFRCVDAGVKVIGESPWGKTHTASSSLVLLGSRVMKIALFAIAVVAFLSELGYPIMSLVAGLGIGGIAIALAAQKTVENLFGAFSLGADEPFRIGDFVKIEDFVGTVEAIGLRSTAVRTLDRTLVTIPNGKLADMRIENFAARDRIRLSCMIGLVYQTSPAQMKTVLAELERALREHEKIWPDAVIVRFAAFAASSLDIEVMAWFQTRDWGEFQKIRQDLFLQFMDIVAEAGSSFAYPTRTIHMIDDPAAKDRDPQPSSSSSSS